MPLTTKQEHKFHNLFPNFIQYIVKILLIKVKNN